MLLTSNLSQEFYFSTYFHISNIFTGKWNLITHKPILLTLFRHVVLAIEKSQSCVRTKRNRAVSSAEYAV